jgi:hypothetical protein
MAKAHSARLVRYDAFVLAELECVCSFNRNVFRTFVLVAPRSARCSRRTCTSSSTAPRVTARATSPSRNRRQTRFDSQCSLRCFFSVLVRNYRNHGFVVVARVSLSVRTMSGQRRSGHVRAMSAHRHALQERVQRLPRSWILLKKTMNCVVIPHDSESFNQKTKKCL